MDLQSKSAWRFFNKAQGRLRGDPKGRFVTTWAPTLAPSIRVRRRAKQCQVSFRPFLIRHICVYNQIPDRAWHGATTCILFQMYWYSCLSFITVLFHMYDYYLFKLDCCSILFEIDSHTFTIWIRHRQALSQTCTKVKQFISAPISDVSESIPVSNLDLSG